MLSAIDPTQYRIANRHKGVRLIGFELTRERAIHRAGHYARQVAKLGGDAFVRVTSPEGFFVYAYSVIGGIMEDHCTDDIPEEHS